MSEEEIKILDNIIKNIEKCMKNNNVDTNFYLPIGNYADFGFISYNMLLNIRNLQQENSQLKERIEKVIPMLKELNIKLKDILKIGIDIKEISDIEKILKGDKSCGTYEKIPVCTLCGEEIGDFDDGGIYEGEYCETCFQDAQESRLK